MGLGSGGRPTGVAATVARLRRAAASARSALPTGPKGQPDPGVRRSPSDVVAVRLAGVERPRIAVLVDGSSPGTVQAVRRRLPAARVRWVRADSGPAKVHAQLAAAGPFDLILDRTGPGATRARLFKDTFQHLRPGGCYVAADHAGALDQVLARLRRARDAAHPRASRRKRDHAALGRAVGSIEAVGDHLVVVNRGAALAKVQEKQADRVLALRGGDDRVLHTVPAATFASRCSFATNLAARPDRMAEIISAPPASLREYHHAVCVPGQVVVSGNLVLPETYRHNQRRRLVNRHTEELGRRFATVAADLDAAPVLEGSYFYLDNENRGHFGHALTEQVALLWALPLAREHAGRLKAVMAVNRRKELEPFELELFGAAGLGPEDLVLLHEPTRVERLLTATPMFSMPHYVHPEIKDVWAGVGDALAARATLRPENDRIFISRRIAKRACRNAAEVEELFVRHGFTLVYPEDLSLSDQVAMFRRADVIAGFAGSGLFNACFVPEPTRVIQLHHEGYTANNEYLIASVLGHALVSVVSELDRSEDDDLRNVPRFQSSFTVDLEREGQFLRDVLAAL